MSQTHVCVEVHEVYRTAGDVADNRRELSFPHSISYIVISPVALYHHNCEAPASHILPPHIFPFIRTGLAFKSLLFIYLLAPAPSQPTSIY
jgi:hypothetical protein